jgi:hypothetical protein
VGCRVTAAVSQGEGWVLVPKFAHASNLLCHTDRETETEKC